MRLVKLFFVAISYFLIGARFNQLAPIAGYEPECVGYLNQPPPISKFEIEDRKMLAFDKFSEFLLFYNFDQQGKLSEEQRIKLPISFKTSLEEYERKNNQRIVFNDRYLVISDGTTNSVVLYGRNNSDLWFEIKKILPPKGSIFEQNSSGFGNHIVLAEDSLAIVAEAYKPKKGRYGKQYLGIDSRTLYHINLTSDLQPRLVIEQKARSDFLSQIVAERDRLVFVSQNRNIFGKWKNRINILTNHKGDYKLKKIWLSNRLPDLSSSKIRVINNHLLTSGIYQGANEAWLIDLDKPKDIESIRLENALFGSLLALSDEFAVLGTPADDVLDNPTTSKYYFPKLIAKSLKNGSIFAIDAQGKSSISLEKDILARVEYERAFYIQDVNTLEVFRLDKDQGFISILKRENVNFAQIDSGFLISIQPTLINLNFCVESITNLIHY